MWTDFQHDEEFWPANRAVGNAKSEQEHTRLFRAMLEHQPYYAFNAQRVDLAIA